jgi:predicted nucleic acid-binding protein
VIVVDTSVWIEALRKGESAQARTLRSLLDADEVALAVPVKIELLGGASVSQRPQLRRALSALPMLYPSDETWTVVDKWMDAAGRAGERFGVGDLLIAAMAHETDGLVWSLDSDFLRMERLGFVGLYEPEA